MNLWLPYVAGLTDSWGSVSDLHAYAGFCCSKKIKKTLVHRLQ